MPGLEVIGADWCPDCRRTKALLDQLQVRYTYNDADNPKENAAKVSGDARIPCVKLPNDTFLNEPSDAELTAKLKELGLVTS